MLINRNQKPRRKIIFFSLQESTQKKISQQNLWNTVNFTVLIFPYFMLDLRIFFFCKLENFWTLGPILFLFGVPIIVPRDMNKCIVRGIIFVFSFNKPYRLVWWKWTSFGCGCFSFGFALMSSGSLFFLQSENEIDLVFTTLR